MFCFAGSAFTVTHLFGDAMSYLTIKEKATSEYTEKRSKFIGTAYPCQSEGEAMELLNKLRSEYWDARHNCYAFVVDEGKTARFSDDGEPHGTAGKPILEVINGKNLKNALVVVTRYFGGVLLGTGGLVRAYSTATRDALEKAEIVEMVPCTKFSTICDYADHQKLQRLMENAFIESTDFADRVTVIYSLKDSDAEDFSKKLTEAFCGRLQMTELSKTVAPFVPDIR